MSSAGMPGRYSAATGNELAALGPQLTAARHQLDGYRAVNGVMEAPGTGQDLAAFQGSDRKSEEMFRATLLADPRLTANDVAVTTWMGYDRPMNLAEAAFPGRAETGGAGLDSFINGMHASHTGAVPAIDTVIGHSYGSTLVGGAATGGNYLAADTSSRSAVLACSPTPPAV